MLAYNPSTMGDGNGRIDGVCWTPIWLQAQWKLGFPLHLMATLTKQLTSFILLTKFNKLLLMLHNINTYKQISVSILWLLDI